jgi:hypothetical protein
MLKSAYRWVLMLGILAAPVCLVQSYATENAGSQPELRTLTGHVVRSQNEPVQKAIVYLKNTKTLAIKTYISEADGSYRFPALSPNVDYEVYAEFQGASSDTKTISAFDNRKQVNITLKLRSK